MNAILHIDTSGPVAIAMLAKGGRPVATCRSEGEREHAGNINRLIDDVLLAGGTTLKELAAIAVCNGPGSYTGLRIGLATAKGFCYALDKPLILHNRLLLMLREAATQWPEAASYAAILPARAGEYYAAVETLQMQQIPVHITTTDLLILLLHTPHPLHITGHAAPDLSLVFSRQDIYFTDHDELNIVNWAAAGHEAFTEALYADIAYAAPDYLKQAFINTRRADSQEVKKEG